MRQSFGLIERESIRIVKRHRENGIMSSNSAPPSAKSKARLGFKIALGLAVIGAGAFGIASSASARTLDSAMDHLNRRDRDQSTSNIHSQLIEFTGGDDGTFMIDSSRIGGGDTARLSRCTGLEGSGIDRAFQIREGDE